MQAIWQNNLLINALRLLCGVVALYLLGALGYQAWMDFRLVNSTALLEYPAQSPQSSDSQDTLAIKDVARLNLMGRAAPKSQPRETTKNLPETRLQLTLIGTFASTESGNASALIAAKGEPAVRYAVNDNLPGGATLAEVHANSVVLSRNGRLETLYFPKPSNPGDKRGRDIPLATRAARNSNGGSDQLQPPPRPTSAETIRERLERLRKQKKN